jgi:hypothetical protein
MEPAVDVCRLGVFVVFVALGLLAAWKGRRGDARRHVDVLLLYVLGVTGLVGLTQLESWPFTQWALVNHRIPQKMTSLEIEAQDAAGRGFVVDLRVLQPLAPEEFAVWLKARLPTLGPRGEASLGRFLLARAEAGRMRFLATGRVAPNQWLLRGLAAPYHFHDAKTWRSASQVSRTPFVGLRAYFLEWDPEERFADETRVARRLLFEYRPAS